MVKRVTNKTIKDAMAEMMADGMKEFDPKNQPEMKTIDLYDMFKHKLTPKARQAIESVKVCQLGHERMQLKVEGISDFFILLRKTGNRAVTDDIIDKYSDQYEPKLDLVKYIGRTATLNKLEVAVDRVCNSLNKLAKRGYITGALTPLMGIKLHRISKREKQKICVVSYVAITTAGQEYMKEKMKGCTFEEGGYPKKV